MTYPVNASSPSKTFSDVACTVCGCVCDDLEFVVEGDRITEVRRACDLAEPWYLAINDCYPDAAQIDGRTSTFADAISESVRLLSDSHNPLIYGLSRSSTPGQRAAVRLAEQLGANIDTTASVCHGPSIMAIQQVGEATCSLGEVRHRADLVVFWGANPVESHPRHFERYSVDAVGQFVPRGRADRTIVVIDTKATATSEQADLFLQIDTEQDLEVIWTLRQLIRGDEPSCTPKTGIPLERLRDLAARMTRCTFGVVFFGLGLAQRGLGHLNVEALLRLVADLNSHTRFSARRLRLPGDVTGADSVLCWQTGFPFGVNLARPYPRYNPGEFTADGLLIRDEVDCCLIVGSESTQMLSPQAQARLKQLPTIVLDYPHVSPAWQPHVHFTTAVYGVHAPGTVYRMDEIPIGLHSMMDSPYNTDEEVLEAIRDGLQRNSG
ncbi:MAG: formylmethanofuran dehydrogenase subunit B [Planctomycetaceae bacterium]|nr:formylmethanofuran dehydrogenase subunit B [Planctomycetaceae bacterium]